MVSDLLPSDEDSKLLAQIKEELNAAKSQSVEYYSAVIQRISAIKVPASIKAEVEKLVSSAESKVKELEKAILAGGSAEDLQAVKAEALEEQRVDKIYSKFDSFHKDYLKAQKDYNENLDAVLKTAASGKDISEEQKAKILKTPQQEKDERKLWQHAMRTEQEAIIERDQYDKELKKIDQQILALHKDDHKTKYELSNRKKHIEQRHDYATLKISEIDEHRKEKEKTYKKLRKCLDYPSKHGNENNVNIVNEALARHKRIHGGNEEQKIQEKATHKNNVNQEKEELKEFNFSPFYEKNYSKKVREFCEKSISKRLSPEQKEVLSRKATVKQEIISEGIMLDGSVEQRNSAPLNIPNVKKVEKKAKISRVSWDR